MDGRGREAERGRLQRAAYGRGATDADRRALAEFERREAGSALGDRTPGRWVDAPPPVPVPVTAPLLEDGTSAALPEDDRSAAEPPADGTASAPGFASLRARRFGARTLAIGVLGALVLGVAAGLLAGPLGSRSAFDVFAAPPLEPRESAGQATLLLAGEVDAEAAFPFAGPVLLGETEYWHVYGFLFRDVAAEGGQQVCLGIVPAVPASEAASGMGCSARADFERRGAQVGLSAPGWGGGEVEAAWAPDGSLEITEG